MSTIMQQPKPKAQAHHFHIQHFYRLEKARTLVSWLKALQGRITFTVQGERAIVQSSDPENPKPYSVKYGGPDGKLNCECYDYINRSIGNPHYACYHIIAVQLYSKEVFGI